MAQGGTQASLALGGDDKFFPFRLGLLAVAADDLDLVSAGEFVGQGFELVVDFAGDTVRTQVGVQCERQVKDGRALGQGDGLSPGSEDDNLAGKQVELHRVKEVDSVGLGILEDVGDGTQPPREFLFLLAFTDLVFPVGGKSALGGVVHLAAPDLYFHPVAVGSHDGDMQGAVLVHLGGRQPVAHAVGVLGIDLGHLVVDIPADAFLGTLIVTLKDDARGIQVVHFLKGDVLLLHLVPNRVAGLHARVELIDQSHVIQTLSDGGSKSGKQVVTALLAGVNQAADALVLGGMVVFEAEVLKFGLDGIQTQAVGERGIDVERLTGNLVLLVGGHRLQGAHVVQAVGHLDEHDAHVLAHREQQLAEILGLQ